MNNRLLDTIHKQQPDCTPIWIMRQAGRYLPEYQQLRKQAGSFQTLYRTPELAAQATLIPIERFELDAAIIFSDILIALEALGLKVDFHEQQGPCLANPIRNDKDFAQLTETGETYDFLAQAISLVKRQLQIPLIGFVGSPWTLAVYAVEGQGSKKFLHIRKMLYQAPQLLHKLLGKITDAISLLAQHQLQQGVDIIQIFDSWAGLLSPDHYRDFSLQYIRQLIHKLSSITDKPIILYAKGCPLSPYELMESKAHVLGLDWQTDMHQAFQQVDNKVVLQGNLDPAALYGSVELLKQQVHKILAARPSHCHHIFNLGHGIYPDTPPDMVARLIDMVHHHKLD